MAIMARKYNRNFCLNLKLNSGDTLPSKFTLICDTIITYHKINAPL